MGEATVGKVAAAAAAWGLRVAGVVEAPTSLEVGRDSVSMGVQRKYPLYTWKQEVWNWWSGSQLRRSEGSHPAWKGQTSGLGPW